MNPKKKLLSLVEEYRQEIVKGNYSKATIIVLDLAIHTKERRDS